MQEKINIGLLNQPVKKIVLNIIIAVLLCGFSFETGKLHAIEQSSLTIAGQKITLSKAIELVILNNLTLRKSKYDILARDSKRKFFNKKYAWNLGLGTGYTKNKIPTQTETQRLFQGNEFFQWDVTASISKKFNTGTSISAALKQLQKGNNADPGALSGQPGTGTLDFYNPAFSVTLKQELLKNSFGVNDRRTVEIFKLQEKIEKQNLYNLLAVVVVQALDAYWKVTVAKENVKNNQEELRATKNVRSIIVRNVRIGLSEKFDINRYTALVKAAETKLKLAKFEARKAVRDLLYIINVPITTEVSGVTDLVDVLPKLNIIEELKVAYNKRADFVNAKLKLHAVKVSRKIAENNALPSVSATLSASSVGQDPAFGNSISSLGKFDYPSFSVRVEMKYPLWDNEIKTKVRNAKFDFKRATIALEDLKTDVKNQVYDAVENVKLRFEVLQNQRKARLQFDRYYRGLLRRSKQGKFNSTTVKLALDSKINARQKELEALVQYNMALLRLDLAKNVIFDRYKINVDSLLKKIK